MHSTRADKSALSAKKNLRKSAGKYPSRFTQISYKRSVYFVKNCT